MQDTKYDYFIIGQGLAGSIIATKLLQHNRKVLVFDNQHKHSASAVAAGIINPITGHRLNITDNFAQYRAPAKHFYQQLEQQFKQRFWFDLPQHRLIKNPGQEQYWQLRRKDINYNDYLGNKIKQQSLFQLDENGVTEVKQTNFIAVKPLLETLRRFLLQRQAIVAEQLNYQQLQISDTGININGTLANKIIFCEGYQATQNPWLTHLPFKLAKGDILTLSNSQNITHMLNWGNWLLPNHDGLLRLGSSFDWHDTSDQINPETRLLLLESLHKFTTLKETVMDHQTGIRPSTLQRMPFVGRLSAQNNALCFNGFGSKGCLLMPYYAELLCQHLLNDAPLPAEVTQWL